MLQFKILWYFIVVIVNVIYVADHTLLYAQLNDSAGSRQINSNKSTKKVDPIKEVEFQRTFNEIRKEYLDTRETFHDRWMWLITVIIAVVGLIVPIVLAVISYVMGRNRFRELEAEGRKSVEEARKLVDEIKEHHTESKAYLQDMLSEDIDDPDKVPEVEAAIRDVQSDPERSLIDKVKTEIYILQMEDKFEDAIEKWRSISNIAEGHDNELAAQAWLSIRYLSAKNEDRSIAFDKAMELDPDYTQDYMKRREAKYTNLSRHGCVVETVLHYFDDPKFRNFSTTLEYRIEPGPYIADVVLHDVEGGQLVVIVECKVNESIPKSTIAMLKRVFKSSDTQFGLLAAGTNHTKWTFFKTLGGEVTEITRSEFETGVVESDSS